MRAALLTVIVLFAAQHCTPTVPIDPPVTCHCDGLGTPLPPRP